MKIKGKPTGIIDDKRLKLPGVTFIDQCPYCKREVIDKTPQLSLPAMNKPFTHYMYCDDCNKDWTINIILDISVKVVQ